jgi:hypothetical protein
MTKKEIHKAKFRGGLRSTRSSKKACLRMQSNEAILKKTLTK